MVLTGRGDTGPPDAVMLAAHARDLRRMRRRKWITSPLAVLTVAAGAGILVATDWDWPLVGFSTMTVLMLLAGASFVSTEEPERSCPDTELEAAVVVGVEITSWGRADSDGVHTARVIGRPLGSATGGLVHGYRSFNAERGCPVTPGMLTGFRRHPDMKHLVWVGPAHDPLTLLGLREGRDLPSGVVIEDACVESVTIGNEQAGDWWATTVTVRHGGALLTDTRPRLPEELARFAPGSPVRIIREENGTTCSIVP